jgi:hypothetical protein
MQSEVDICVLKVAYLGTFIQSQKASLTFVMSICLSVCLSVFVHLSVCLSVCFSAALTQWISMQFDIWDFNETLLKNTKFGLNMFYCYWRH